MAIIVANTHLFWHPLGSSVRIRQSSMMMAHATDFNRDVGYAIVMCGDFNSTPDGLTYQLLTSHDAPSFDSMCSIHITDRLIRHHSVGIMMMHVIGS